MVGQRILLTTEGSYPYYMGGVTTWCDYLLHGLPEYRFEVLALLSPRPAPRIALPLPPNLDRVTSMHIWRPRGGRACRAEQRRELAQALEELLGFAYEDYQMFGHGLLRLCQLGGQYNLWPAFEANAVLHQVRAALSAVLGRLPSLAEAILATHWLRAVLVPVAFIPPAPDLAHTVVNGLAGIPAWAASRYYGIPLAITEHGLYLRERYLALSSEPTPPGLKAFQALFYRTLARAFYAQASRVSHVIGFNRFWQQGLGVEASRMQVIYNGVPAQNFPPVAFRPTNAPRLVWVGRIDPLKDLATLIRAFAQVRIAIPRATLHLYGPVPRGNEAYRASLERLIAQLAVEGITFEGPVYPAQQAYQQADLLVLSSVSEGFPYVLVEAMLSQLAIVSTRVGGIPEVLEGGQSGVLVAPQDVAELAHALIEVLTQPELRRELGQRARQRALDQLTLPTMLSAYRYFYQQAWLAAPPAPQPDPVGANQGLDWARWPQMLSDT
jgi:glycosyltransferase involved in cell wall biosynthesis